MLLFYLLCYAAMLINFTYYGFVRNMLTILLEYINLWYLNSQTLPYKVVAIKVYSYTCTNNNGDCLLEYIDLLTIF